MEARLEDSPFFDFGVDDLYPFGRVGLHQVDGSSAEELRSQVKRFVPTAPGVYGMLDPAGRLIYIGKSKALRNRLLSYFLPGNEEDKAGRIVQSTTSIVWEHQPNEFAALLREQRLIREFQPRFNVQGIPRRQQRVYICLGRKPAEQLYTARKHDPKAVVSLGPLAGSGRANRAVEVLNRYFKLRDCSSRQKCSFTEQLQLFDLETRPGCIRLELESCLGPCIAACSRRQYEQQVSSARRFLEGKCDRPVGQLLERMQSAAANLHFERAATLREDLRAVQWLARRAEDLAQARTHYTFVYPVSTQRTAAGSRANQAATPSQQKIWYLIKRGVIEGAMAAPNNLEEDRRTQEILADWLSDEHRVGSVFHPRRETLALVTGWFRKHRGELSKTFLPSIAQAAQSKSSRRSPIARQAVNL